jgi:excisionase family DNA binding protein
MSPVIEAPSDPTPPPRTKKAGRPSLCYTADEVGGFFKVSAKTVYRWAAKNEIPFVKIGGVIRFPVSKINHLLERQGLLSKAA